MHGFRVARLMREDAIQGVSRRRKPVTTLGDPAGEIAKDLVNRDFSATAPNKLWVADITYIPTLGGVLYLGIVLDVFSRRVIGWATAGHMKTQHGFTNYKEAESWAKKNIVGAYKNKDTGETINVSGRSINKFTSGSAVTKSSTKDVHLSVLKQLPKLIENSVLGERHADRDSNPNIKEVQRLYGAISVNGEIQRVKLTVKAYADSKANKAYSYEVTEIEMLGGQPTDASSKGLTSNRTPSISVANLLENAKSNQIF